MLLAAIIAQVGYSRAKRASTDRARFLNSRHRLHHLGLLIVLSIPWPSRVPEIRAPAVSHPGQLIPANPREFRRQLLDFRPDRRTFQPATFMKTRSLSRSGTGRFGTFCRNIHWPGVDGATVRHRRRIAVRAGADRPRRSGSSSAHRSRRCIAGFTISRAP